MRGWIILTLLVVAGCGVAPRTGGSATPTTPRYQLSQRAPGPGALFLIGGGENDAALLKRFVATAGGPDSPLVVVPLANGAPEGDRLKAVFESLGATRVSVLGGRPETRAADTAAIRDAWGLYFTGGLPEKLLAAYPAYREAVTTAWRAGCVVGGTSAGAMVWGSRTIVAGESDQALRHGAGALTVSDGLGLLAGAIVDPHFNERTRFHRLWVAAGDADALGLGIDPRTAAVVGGDHQLTVFGAGTVTLIRPEAAGSRAARVAVLQAGETLELSGWRK